MSVETLPELRALQRVGRAVADARDTMARHLRPGTTTGELDLIGAGVLHRHGARSAPQISVRFPRATCISVNDEAAHGIPGDRVIERGDIVNIDVSAEIDGFFADTGASYPVPPVSPSSERLLRHTRQALHAALAAMRTGARINGTGRAVERAARRGGFHAVRNLCAHGTGRALWESPLQIANYYMPSDRRRFTEGQVIAMEVFLAGSAWVEEAGDGWTLRTVDGSRAAQYEHTVMVTRGGAVLLTG